MTEKPENTILINERKNEIISKNDYVPEVIPEKTASSEGDDSDYFIQGENEVEEEDSIDPAEDIEDDGEIDGLVEDSELPIEQLLAKYGMASETSRYPVNNNKRVFEDEPINQKKVRKNSHLPAEISLEEHLDDKTQPENQIKPISQAGDSTDTDASNDPEDREEENNTEQNNWCKALISDTNNVYNSDEDEDYIPSEVIKTWKAEVRIGSEYQIEVPSYEDEENQPSIEFEQRITKGTSLLWDPRNLSESQVIEYEREYAEKMKAPLPTERTVDYEEALFLLTQCNYDPKEAMNRISLGQFDASTYFGNYMSTWSEQDCQAFERGFALFNKDFRQIHLLKLKHRSINEIIFFYYMWKKTARYDEFSKIHRRNKKKPVHPGMTDFMDCLTHEQEMIAESLMNGTPAPNMALDRAFEKTCVKSQKLLLLEDQSKHTSLKSDPFLLPDTEKNSLSANTPSSAPIIDVPDHTSSTAPLIV